MLLSDPRQADQRTQSFPFQIVIHPAARALKRQYKLMSSVFTCTRALHRLRTRRRTVEVIICMISRDFSVILNDVTGVSLSLCLLLLLTKVTDAQYRKRFRASNNNWVWKSTEKWRRSARSKLPAGIGWVIDWPVTKRKLRLFLGFSASPRRPRNYRRSSCRCISKYSQSSPRVSQSSPQVRKSLVLCREKTLRDKVGVVVIKDTRANCIAKKECPKAERKCWNWALKTRHQKRGNFVAFLCMERVSEWITVRDGTNLFFLWHSSSLFFVIFTWRVVYDLCSSLRLRYQQQ